MRWVLRLFGFPVFELHADEQTEYADGGTTGGQFELASGDLSVQYEEDPEAFGFRGSP